VATRCTHPDHHYHFAGIPSLISLRAVIFERERGLLSHPAETFLDFAAGVLGGAGYLIFVHDVLRCVLSPIQGPKPQTGLISSLPANYRGCPPSPGEDRQELRGFPPRSWDRMKRPFHELSDRERRQVAEELMMQPSAFGVFVIVAALVLFVFLWSPIPDLIASAGNATVAQQKVAYIKPPSN
jgi:hypothetical protein